MQRSSRDRSRARASFTGSDMNLVGLHRIGGRASGHERDNRNAGEKLPQRLTPPAPAAMRGAASSGFLAGFGAPTRSRRSESDSRPPNAIKTGPHQIKSTSGL